MMPRGPRGERHYPWRLEHFKNETEIKAVHSPPRRAASTAGAWGDYGRAILQAGL
jgi:hypothetical protein